MTTRATMLVAAVIAVRVLAPGAFGAYAYAVAVASIANFVIDLGIASLVTRDVSQDASRAPQLLGAFVKVQLLLAALTFVLVSASPRRAPCRARPRRRRSCSRWRRSPSRRCRGHSRRP